MSTTAPDLRPGQIVQVELERHDGPRRARVIRVPPFSEQIAGETHRITDKVEVEYADTADNTPPLFGPIREDVSFDAILAVT